ncbi:MAG: GNAT family N-acetyltransferase [Pseudomonadota bacterium]
MTTAIRIITSKEDINTALAIRHTVFVVEQNVPLDLELDGLDEICVQFLATVDDLPVATGRLQPVEDQAKLQRICVLESYRGLGLAALIVQAMLDHARECGKFRSAFLEAQTDAVGLYEKFGFVAEGEIFMDAGIPHIKMSLCLTR